MKKIIAMQPAETPSGEIVTLYEVEENPDAGADAGSDGRHSGIRRMELADGRVLKMVGHGEYEVEGTNEVFLVIDTDQ
jgi:hypothetical protein